MTVQMTPENRTRNTVAGAAVGALAGGGIGYATKQVVKDNQLTNDVFQRVVNTIEEDNKKVLEPFKEIDDLAEAAKKAQDAVGTLAEDAYDAAKAAHKELEDKAKEAADKLTDAKNALLKSNNRELKDGENLDDVVKELRSGVKTTEVGNITLLDSDVAKALKGAVEEGKETSIDKMKEVIKSYQDSKVEIKGLVKDTITEEALNDEANVKKFFGQIQEAVKTGETNKETLTGQIKGLFQDNSKKLKENFEEGSEKLGEIVKKAMKSAKLKQAAIVGGIAAAVLGAGAFLLSGKKADKTEQADK